MESKRPTTLYPSLLPSPSFTVPPRLPFSDIGQNMMKGGFPGFTSLLPTHHSLHWAFNHLNTFHLSIYNQYMQGTGVLNMINFINIVLRRERKTPPPRRLPLSLTTIRTCSECARRPIGNLAKVPETKSTSTPSKWECRPTAR
jgi:hypothetical protein